MNKIKINNLDKNFIIQNESFQLVNESLGKYANFNVIKRFERNILALKNTNYNYKYLIAALSKKLPLDVESGKYILTIIDEDLELGKRYLINNFTNTYFEEYGSLISCAGINLPENTNGILFEKVIDTCDGGFSANYSVFKLS